MSWRDESWSRRAPPEPPTPPDPSDKLTMPDVSGVAYLQLQLVPFDPAATFNPDMPEVDV